MVTYLDKILESHRLAAANDPRSTRDLEMQCRSLPDTRGFRRAIEECDGLAVISEIKRRSPSKGDLLAHLDPIELAGHYERGGATCLSVLTDSNYFGGSPDDLDRARGAVSLPVLRKDFTVCANDVLDARIMGADCLLLIVAALSYPELVEMFGLAKSVGLDVLVETHDEKEVESAVRCGAQLIGVNQRDLVTFAVDTDRAVRVATSIPAGITKVAESGVKGPSDAGVLRRAGYQAVLVGETLVSSPDPAATVAELRNA